MVGLKLIRVLSALAIVVVAWGIPRPAVAAGASSSGCADTRPGPAPVIDHVGKVGVPAVYCYYPNDDHKDWHDYCSFGQGDTWAKAGVVVSFKGACAYHDLCLEYGWGFSRSTCDAVFGVYMRRNCIESVRHSRVPDILEGWVTSMCMAKAERMYAGVHAYTWSGLGGYKRGPWRCLVRTSGQSVRCDSWLLPW